MIPIVLLLCFLLNVVNIFILRDFKFIGKVNFIIHESTKDTILKTGHSNPYIAAKDANDVEADYLLLTHFSYDYTEKEFNIIKERASSATKSKVVIMHDGEPFDLPYLGK